jgi:uncharacterized protein (DUF488 family)
MPQFGSEALTATLQARGLEYLWLPGLGGRRNPLPDSPNTAWRSPAFRGYADYLETEPFSESLAELISMASGMRTAVMCAEAVWWRCHRGLIADVLRWLGFEVLHILGPGSRASHPYTSAAQLEGGRLSYAAPAGPVQLQLQLTHRSTLRKRESRGSPWP